MKYSCACSISCIFLPYIILTVYNLCIQMKTSKLAKGGNLKKNWSIIESCRTHQEKKKCRYITEFSPH